MSSGRGSARTSTPSTGLARWRHRRCSTSSSDVHDSTETRRSWRSVPAPDRPPVPWQHPATKHPDLVEGHAPEVRASGRFGEPVEARHRFDVVATAAEYVANLATQTGVKQLGSDAQTLFLDRVRRRVEAHGGSLTVHYLAVLTVAPLAESS